MKKILFILAIGGSMLIMANCTPKVASSVADKEPVPTKAQVLASFSEDQLARGKAIFIDHCAKCHKLFPEDSRTPVQWNSILKKMIPKAKLNYDDGKLVRAYLIAHSKADS